MRPLFSFGAIGLYCSRRCSPFIANTRVLISSIDSSVAFRYVQVAWGQVSHFLQVAWGQVSHFPFSGRVQACLLEVPDKAHRKRFACKQPPTEISILCSTAHDTGLTFFQWC